MKPEIVFLSTDVGHKVAVRHFEVSSQFGSDAKGVCILASATGIAQYLYDDFASWLTTQGYHVVTFDYCGIGLSLDDHVKNLKSDGMSWANHDGAAVLNYAAASFPGLERIWIGHSIGGHLPCMIEDFSLIDRIITGGAGTGTWWLSPWPTRRVAWLFWCVVVSVSVPLMGYFPGKKTRHYV